MPEDRSRHDLLINCGEIHLTFTHGDLAHQSDQRGQVGRTEATPPRGQHDEGVGRLDVRPARRERAQALLTGLAEEDALLAPGVRIPDQLELAPAQRMEGVGDADPLRTSGTACIRRRSTRLPRKLACRSCRDGYWRAFATGASSRSPSSTPRSKSSSTG